MFKPGDKIVLVKGLGKALAGQTAVVGPKGIFSSLSGVFLDVIWDSKSHMNDGGYYVDNFTLKIEFKPGDKVKLVRNTGMAAQIGATATVRAVNKDCLDVIWDDNNLRAHPQDPNAKQMHGDYSSVCFELLISPKTKIDYLQITREIVGSR